MTADLWQSGSIFDWQEAFYLPTQPWLESLLPLLGLPPDLVERPGVLVPLHAQLFPKFSTRLQAAGESYQDEGVEDRIVQQVVTEALQQLADEMGASVAIDFERWARRHFISTEVSAALHAWSSVLHWACCSTELSMPAILVERLPKIDDLFSQERWQSLKAEVSRLALPPSEEDKELGLDESPAAMKVKQIVDEEWIIAALKILATGLTATQEAELVEWAKISAEKIYVPLEHLQDGKYLRTEPPLSDIPAAILS